MADAQDSRRTTTGRRGWEPSTCQPVGQQTPVSFSACCAAAIQTASCQTGDNTTCKHVTKKELCNVAFPSIVLLRVPNKLFSHVCYPFFLTQKTNAAIIPISKTITLTASAVTLRRSCSTPPHASHELRPRRNSAGSATGTWRLHPFRHEQRGGHKKTILEL